MRQCSPFSTSASLTSNRSAKSEPASTRTLTVSGLFEWVEDGDVLVEAIPDEPLADDGQGGIAVDRSRLRDEEELRGVVLLVLDRVRVRSRAVHGEAPAREETRVTWKRPWGWLGWASMSPQASLAAKVRPSRMLIVSVAVGASPTKSSCVMAGLL